MAGKAPSAKGSAGTETSNSIDRTRGSNKPFPTLKRIHEIRPETRIAILEAGLSTSIDLRYVSRSELAALDGVSQADARRIKRGVLG